MAKINFTKEHYNKLLQLAAWMLMGNITITTKMGTVLNIVELLHTTTIQTLNNIRLSLGKAIETLENQDEWVAETASQSKLAVLKNQKELVNLIIGWKRFNLEAEENAQKKRELTAKLNQLKESTKSPEDKIKELEAEIASLGDTEEFA